MAEAPSFDCAKTNGAVEQAICATPDLAAADRTMAALYASVRVSAFGTGPSNELAAQRKALETIRGCQGDSKPERLAECLRQNYAGRNGDLAVAAVMRTPGAALAVMRQIDPGYAPVLEAVQIWAAEPDGADWSAPSRAEKRARITALITPHVDRLLKKDDMSFGGEILSSSSVDHIEVKRAADVFLSERHFARFLNVLGPYLDEPAYGLNVRRVLPCAAMVRHPALAEATDAVFGSTLDNFTFDHDCAETLPPLPALETLVQALYKKWPDCEGTIRFAAYRSFSAAVRDARLGRIERSSAARAETLPRRNGITPANVSAARSELASYYGTYLGKSPARAAAMASTMISGILSSAHQCE
ncbi:MAG: hypothetical protein JSR96_02540 [Proteobacteria bacterium]|nr:hypothetical protein [Pseudomonadota bacterium]